MITDFTRPCVFLDKFELIKDSHTGLEGIFGEFAPEKYGLQ